LRPYLAAVATTLFALTTHAQHVTAPHASVVDVTARQATLKSTTDPLLRSAIKSLHSCVSTPAVDPPTGPMQIPHHYLSGSHGPTNPAEAAATRRYAAFENRITAGMNQYLATGSQAESACALAQLDTWAQAKTLMDYDPFANHNENAQSWYQAEWTLSAAGVTFSVLVNDPALDPAQLTRVKQWLNTATHKLIGFEKPGAEGNNHHYWRALAAISVGVSTSDDKLFRFGVDTYKQAINQLDKNAAFPLEMARHEMSTHYQAFALQPLVLVAEFATRQGTDLYAYTANGHTLRDAIDFLAHAIEDPSIIKQYTPDEQKANFGGGDYAPFAFLAARFPNQPLPPTIAAALTKPTSATRIGGSTTLLAGK
jgi:poly(beta-D-mannuronate) lyase